MMSTRSVARFLHRTLGSPGMTSQVLSHRFSSTTASPSVEEVQVGKRYFPRRCLMYIPGSDEKKLAKVMAIKSDSFVFDCEDGVAANQKEQARNKILSFLQTIDKKSPHIEFGVRVNSLSSGLTEQDLKVLLSGERIPHTIYLPKVETVKDIETFGEMVGAHMQKKDKDINLVIYAESAASLINLKDICTHARNMEQYHIYNLDAVVFGSDDYIASIGATRSPEGSECLVARQQVVMNAKAFGLEAIDMVYTDLSNQQGLKQQCIEGSKMGFTGKQCIHPDQVQVILTSFTPTQDRIDWAHELIDQFGKHQATGEGAFVFQGSMVDKPLLLQAENIVKMSKLVDL